jgi:hypothetical protein
VQRYVLEFGVRGQADRRRFDSEEARKGFLEQSFSNLSLSEIPESKRERRRIVSPVESIVGEYLSSVAFVMNYLQLDFSGHKFTMYQWPTVTIRNETRTDADGEYKNVMCSLIGETIAGVDEYWDTGLRLRFTNGSYINLALRPEGDFSGPEVAEFHTPTKLFALVWETGEEPFH